MVLNILWVIVGFILLVKGADFLVEGSSDLAKKFHIPSMVIGLTIVAIGTSMPELVVSVDSGLKGLSDMSLGNVIGSNIADLLLILGVCSIIKPLKITKSTLKVDNPFSIICTIVLFILCLTGSIISRVEGAILLIGCALYIGYNIMVALKSMDEFVGKKTKKTKNIFILLLYIIGGIVALKFGGDLVVDNCVSIAKILGVSEKMISLTIIAIGTSLPELVTSVKATRMGDTDLAIGNVIGSELFNILLILGVSSILSPIHYSSGYNITMILLLISTILMQIFSYTGKKNYLDRINGIIFTLMYIGYTLYLIIVNV